MLSLLRNDFLRFLREKAIIIGICIVVGINLFTIGIYEIVGLLGDEAVIGDMDVVGRTVFFSSFSPTNNGGALIPMFIAIAVLKDFTNGTIRNKMISGHTRTQIVLSTLITSITFGTILLLFNVLSALGLGSVFMTYGRNIDLSEFGTIMTSIGLGALVNCIYVTCIVFACFAFRSMPVGIISAFVFIIVFSLIFSMNAISGLPEALYEIVSITPCGLSNFVINAEFTDTNILKMILGSLGHVFVFSVASVYIFNRIDVK